MGVGGNGAQEQIVRWNGTSWSSISAAPPEGATAAFLQSVDCTSNSQCFIAGWYESANGEKRPLFQKWFGSTVENAPPPYPESGELTGVSCEFWFFCVLVGNRLVGGKSLPFGIALERTNIWKEVHYLGSVETNRRLEDVSCSHHEYCEAVGYHTEAGVNIEGSQKRLYVARYYKISDSWSRAFGSEVGIFTGVACLKEETACLAVGVRPGTPGWKPMVSTVEDSSFTAPVTPNLPSGLESGELMDAWCGEHVMAGCWAVGSYRTSSQQYPLALKKLSSGWGVYGNGSLPNTGSPENGFLGISCTTTELCTAVGSTGGFSALVERFQ
jgi:hypothetical protein